MTNTTCLPGLFPIYDEDTPAAKAVRLRNTGILPSLEIAAFDDGERSTANPAIRCVAQHLPWRRV
jgi:hypothetical protein